MLSSSRKSRSSAIVYVASMISKKSRAIAQVWHSVIPQPHGNITFLTFQLHTLLFLRVTYN